MRYSKFELWWISAHWLRRLIELALAGTLIFSVLTMSFLILFGLIVITEILWLIWLFPFTFMIALSISFSIARLFSKYD